MIIIQCVQKWMHLWHYVVLKTATPPLPDTSNAFSTLFMPAYSEEEYMAVLTIMNVVEASLNWESYTHPNDDTVGFTSHATYSAGHALIVHLDNLPFIVNSGTICHISLKASNFKTLHPIPHCHDHGWTCISLLYHPLCHLLSSSSPLVPFLLTSLSLILTPHLMCLMAVHIHQKKPCLLARDSP